MSINNWEHLRGHIDNERFLRLVEHAVNHYSPSYAEESVIQVFTRALEQGQVPFRLQPVDGEPGCETERFNIIVELGPQPPTLLWIGHMDTVAMVGDDEYGAEWDGDVLYGLGTADMKGGCAAAVEALCALVASGVPLVSGLCVALVVGEEEYGDGAAELMRELSAPVAVIGEPTGLVPCTSHYGYLECMLTAKGTKAHAALPEVGKNAIHAMLSWMLRILDRVAELPNAQDVAVNPREIRGGQKLFAVPDQCESLLDIHLPPGADKEPILKLIDEARQAAETTHPGCECSSEELYWAKGYASPQDYSRLAPLMAAFSRADVPFYPTAFRSHSDGNLLFERNVIPVVCGPGRLEVAHTRNEHVHRQELIDAVRLYAALFYEFCVAPGEIG